MTQRRLLCIFAIMATECLCISKSYREGQNQTFIVGDVCGRFLSKWRKIFGYLWLLLMSLKSGNHATTEGPALDKLSLVLVMHLRSLLVWRRSFFRLVFSSLILCLL